MGRFVRVLGTWAATTTPSTIDEGAWVEDPHLPFVIPDGPPVPAGRQIVAIGWNNYEEPPRPGLIGSIVDSRGNSWQVDVGGPPFIGATRASIKTALVPGDTITVENWQAVIFVETSGIPDRLFPTMFRAATYGDGPALPGDPNYRASEPERTVSNFSEQTPSDSNSIDVTGRPNGYVPNPFSIGPALDPIEAFGPGPCLAFAFDYSVGSVSPANPPPPPDPGGDPGSGWVPLGTVAFEVSFYTGGGFDAPPPVLNHQDLALLTAYYQIVSPGAMLGYTRSSPDGSGVAFVVLYTQSLGRPFALVFWTWRRFLFYGGDAGLVARRYNYATPAEYDEKTVAAGDCSYPSAWRHATTLEGVFLLAGVLNQFSTTDHGESYTVTALGGAYDASTACLQGSRLVHCGFKSGQWYVKVGDLVNLIWTFGAEQLIALAFPAGDGMVNPNGDGYLICQPDQTLLLFWDGTDGNWYITENHGIDKDGNGAWK